MAGAGAVGVVIGQRALAACLGKLDEASARTIEKTALPMLQRAIWVIAFAVLVYLGARQFGYGKIGLYVCVTVLVVNAITVAVLRVRLVDGLQPREDLGREHHYWTWEQALANCLGFIGCAIYLLRD